MNDNEGKPVVSKGYLYLLPVIMIGLGLQLLFNNEFRSLLGMRQIKGLISEKQAVIKDGGSAVSPVKKKEFNSEDASRVADYLSGIKTPIVVPPVVINVTSTPPVISDPVTNIVCGGTSLTAAVQRVETIWPFVTRGICAGEFGERAAIIGGVSDYRANCVKGMRLESSDTNNCTYTILHVGERCVWVEACSRAGEGRSSLPVISAWPVLKKIVREYDHNKGGYKPVRVEFADGAKLTPGQSYKWSSDPGLTFTLSSFLNDVGVVFDIESGTNTIKVVCSVVAM